MTALSSRYTYEGTETTETSITRVGGATDPSGSLQARKIVTTANSQWLRPFKAEPYAVWNATTAANVTVTVCGTINSGTLPNNDEIFLEVEYLGSSSTTLGTIITTTKSNVLASGSAVASDSSTWNGGGSGGGWSPFKLTTTLSSPQPGQAGYIHARVRAAKASATYYIDPTIELSPSGATAGATTPYTTSRYTYEGTETTETSITRVNGAVDPLGNRQSRKITTTANSQWLRPFKAEPYAQWSNVTGSNVSVTVCGTINSGALPNNDDIWMDVEYLGDASSPLGKIVNTTKANVLATGTSVTSDGSSWSGGGSGAGWSPFKLTKTLSSPQPGQAGYIHVRPRVAKASSTFYIDPKIVVT